MNRYQVIILVCFSALYGCELFEKPNPNLPPKSFKVIVSKTYANSAIIEWEKATDPENDLISYSVLLDDIIVADNLKDVFKLEIKDLQSDKFYSGSVIATDSKKNSFKVSFTFNSQINSAPDSFKITISKITYNQAFLEWAKAKDTDNDSVSYSIKLNGIEIATEITNQYHFECKNLQPETHYEGTVIATDSKNNLRSVPFNFTTSKKYLKFNKIIPIKGLNIVAYTIDKTTDGGYILGGEGLISDGWNFLAIKTDSLANIEWYKYIPLNYPGMGIGEVQIKQTNDQGYLMLGQKRLIKLNSSGDLVWQYTQSQDLTDPGFGLASFYQTSDNGYIVTGSFLKGYSPIRIQAYIAKFNEDGVIQWQKYFGTAQRNHGWYIEKTNDGNYVILGTSINEGDSGGYLSELFVTKIDPDGNILWNQFYPNTEYSYDFAKQIKITKNNDFIITGFSLTYDQIYHGRVLKIDKDGNSIWDQYFNWDSHLTMIMAGDPTKDSGVAITGMDGYVPQGCILAKVDADGNLKWNRDLRSGTACGFQGRDIKVTQDGGFIVIGSKGCVWGDDGNEHGLWIFKSDPDGNYEN